MRSSLTVENHGEKPQHPRHALDQPSRHERGPWAHELHQVTLPEAHHRDHFRPRLDGELDEPKPLSEEKGLVTPPPHVHALLHPAGADGNPPSPRRLEQSPHAGARDVTQARLPPEVLDDGLRCVRRAARAWLPLQRSSTSDALTCHPRGLTEDRRARGHVDRARDRTDAPLPQRIHGEVHPPWQHRVGLVAEEEALTLLSQRGLVLEDQLVLPVHCHDLEHALHESVYHSFP